jgi:hypothetical protein
MVTIKIDRRVLYALVFLAIVALALAGGALFGRTLTQSGAPAAPTAVAGAPLPPDASSAAALPTVAVPTADATLGALPRISIDEAKAQLGNPNAIFIDVRTPDQFLQGHIQGAQSLPEAEVATRMAELPKDKDLILYCA